MAIPHRIVKAELQSVHFPIYQGWLDALPGGRDLFPNDAWGNEVYTLRGTPDANGHYVLCDAQGQVIDQDRQRTDVRLYFPGHGFYSSGENGRIEVLSGDDVFLLDYAAPQSPFLTQFPLYLDRLSGGLGLIVALLLLGPIRGRRTTSSAGALAVATLNAALPSALLLSLLPGLFSRPPAPSTIGPLLLPLPIAIGLSCSVMLVLLAFWRRLQLPVGELSGGYPFSSRP